ncbi:hypothetical protein D9758_005535 [Tetrapyrgos nigripes]|uniref:Major facilitator superfamily (MFS) profile domain-containing protein n=1 Tax=Tetrapyrgos nigripes TaxID=182062 RepID=A0A8H5GH32_9AGAR|nr:hypothetical protein D9758_005535 [Tetrapyrgos nigripes]
MYYRHLQNGQAIASQRRFGSGTEIIKSRMSIMKPTIIPVTVPLLMFYPMTIRPTLPFSLFKARSRLFRYPNPSETIIQAVVEKPLGPSLPSSLEKSAETADTESALETRIRVSTASSLTLCEDDIYSEGSLRSCLVVFGAMLLGFTFGYVNAWGVFQAYYEEYILPSTSSSAIAWIGSSQHACSSLIAPIVGRLFDLGYFHSILITGTVGLVLATFLTAECHVYWQFLICQGILFGISLGLCDALSLMVIPQWFTKYRGLAYGSIRMDNAYIRILFPVDFTMRRRTVAAEDSLSASDQNFFEFRPLKSPAFTVYCLSTLIEAIGYYALPTYVVTSSQSIGVSSSLSFYLVSILNGSGGIAHIFEGWGADHFGAMNMQIPFTVLTAVMLWIWPFAKTQASLIIVVVFFGLSSDSSDTLPSTAVASMGNPGELGRRLGLLNLFLGIGELIGPPLAGKVNQSFGLEAMALFSGGMVLFGLLLILTSRNLALGRWIGKV